MFTTPEEPTGFYKLILDSLKVTKPWDFENNPKKLISDLDMDVISERKRFFAVGSKEERQRWKQNHEHDTGQVCDCCGQNIGKKPWAKKQCNCYSMSYSPKIPWRF